MFQDLDPNILPKSPNVTLTRKHKVTPELMVLTAPKGNGWQNYFLTILQTFWGSGPERMRPLMRSSDGNEYQSRLTGGEKEMFSRFPNISRLWDDSIMAGLLTTGLLLMSPSAAEIKRDRERGNKTNNTTTRYCSYRKLSQLHFEAFSARSWLPSPLNY